MKIESYVIPSELSTLIMEGTFKKIYAPYSGASTYRIDQVTGSRTYLKILPTPHREPLEQYQEKLLWLEGKLPVPKVLFYSKDEKFEYILMSEVIGLDATDPVYKENTELLIRKLAHALKQVHKVKISDCPFDYTLNKRLKVIEKKIEDGLFDRQKIEDEFRNDSFENLYQTLIAKPFSSEDLVFTHGDYSVPNVIIDHENISGFIDMADAGIADRYRDLAAMHYSIIRNFGEEWIGLFHKEYGITNVDYKKIKYYDVLEAFYCF